MKMNRCCSNCKVRNCPVMDDSYLNANYGIRYVQDIRDRITEIIGCELWECK